MSNKNNNKHKRQEAELAKMNLLAHNSPQLLRLQQRQQILLATQETSPSICSRQLKPRLAAAVELLAARAVVEVEVAPRQASVALELGPVLDEEALEVSLIWIFSEITPSSSNFARLYRHNRRCWSQSFSKSVRGTLNLPS